MTGVNDDLLNRSDLLVNATLNGIYQGLIVAALVAITLRLLPRTNAATRHAVWFFTLFLIVSIIPVHLFYNALLPNGEQNSGTHLGLNRRSSPRIPPRVADRTWLPWRIPSPRIFGDGARERTSQFRV